MQKSFRIGNKSNGVLLDVTKGHFSTSHSHINYFIDVTSKKACLSEAKEIAQVLMHKYKHNTLVDTVLCLDGTEVIGACLANELTKPDFMSINSNREIYVLTPEYISGSQLFFRDNIAPMIEKKHVLILAASVVTGYTAKSAMEAIKYYSGEVAGIASVFATLEEYLGVPVISVFNPKDLPGYASYTPYECPMCKNGEKLDALINSHGCSKL